MSFLFFRVILLFLDVKTKADDSTRSTTRRDILINLHIALHNLRRAWTEVKPQTIANCFRHAKYVINPEVEETVADEAEGIDELLDAWRDLQLLGGINKEAAMMDFMDVDADVITDGALTLEEIVAEVSAVEEKESNDAGDSQQMEGEEEEPVVTRQEAQTAFNLVRRFVEKISADPVMLIHSDAFDEYFYQERKKNEIQSQLTNFFSIV